jgi:hypothetical protein
VDILSDVANAVFKLLLVLSPAKSASVVPDWLMYLFIVLGVATVPLGIYQIFQRGRVKTSYRQIIRGDDPELAKALDAAGGTLSPESIAIRRSLIVLDMTVCDVGIRGFFIEDLPSILLNSAVILLEMRAGSKADKSTFASFVGLLFSCLMTGRKSGLRGVRRELRQKKLDLEQVERMQGDIAHLDASQKRLRLMNEDLEEEMRLKKHSEEELKVMMAALEAVSKERRDELKEVMMESKELKIDRLLGKGG